MNPMSTSRYLEKSALKGDPRGVDRNFAAFERSLEVVREVDDHMILGDIVGGAVWVGESDEAGTSGRRRFYFDPIHERCGEITRRSR